VVIRPPCAVFVRGLRSFVAVPATLRGVILRFLPFLGRHTTSTLPEKTYFFPVACWWCVVFCDLADFRGFTLRGAVDSAVLGCFSRSNTARGGWLPALGQHDLVEVDVFCWILLSLAVDCSVAWL